MDPKNVSSLVFSMSTYQVFDDDAATAVLAFSQGEMGLVMWNLGPGQENDYHLHPSTDHLHVIVEGQVEYTLGGGEPVTVKVGEAVMVPEGVAHGIRNVTDQRATYLAIVRTRAGTTYEKILAERK
jgi:quercetin dioxygenase-like cupin family protein